MLRKRRRPRSPSEAFRRGRFVVAAPMRVRRLHVASLMCDFLAKYPAVNTGELALSDRIANLVEEGIDAAVRIGVLEDSSYVARQVGATRRVVVASPQYLARRKKPRSPEDLGRHDVIQFTALTPTRDWRFFHDGRERIVEVTARYVTKQCRRGDR